MSSTLSTAAVRRLGVYGGAFDPPHQAHVALAEAAIGQLDLDRLQIVPTGDAWHKSSDLSPARHRLRMCELAFGALSKVQVDARELHRKGPSYTADTLAELQSEHVQAELFLLMGADQARDFVRWHQQGPILRMATLAIAERSGPGGAQLDVQNPLPGLCSELQQQARVQLLTLPALPHSATQVRTRVASGQDISDLVPPAVARYIADHQLYSGPSSNP